MAAIHVLKTWPEHWDALAEGRKTFEARRDDRGYQIGDALVLRRFCPTAGFDTTDGKPRDITRWVTHLLRGPAFGIEDGYVVMSLAERPA